MGESGKRGVAERRCQRRAGDVGRPAASISHLRTSELRHDAVSEGVALDQEQRHKCSG